MGDGSIYFALLSGAAALLFMWYLASYVMKQNPGNEKMQRISGMIQEGAKAFLKREYSYVFTFVLVIGLLIVIAPFIKQNIDLGWQTAVCFVFGALVSALAGYIGMSIATRANARTAEAARTKGLNGALDIAVSGGAVMGMSVVGLALIGLCVVYLIFREPVYINGYAMGASLVALFARLRGALRRARRAHVLALRPQHLLRLRAGLWQGPARADRLRAQLLVPAVRATRL